MSTGISIRTHEGSVNGPTFRTESYNIGLATTLLNLTELLSTEARNISEARIEEMDAEHLVVSYRLTEQGVDPQDSLRMFRYYKPAGNGTRFEVVLAMTKWFILATRKCSDEVWMMLNEPSD